MPTVVDSRTNVVVATVSQPTISGQITEVLYWNYSSNSWQSSPPTNVPVGQQIGVKVTGKNTGTNNQVMWFNLTLKKPDGTVDWQGSSTMTTLTPNTTTFVELKRTASVAGQWTCDIQFVGDLA